MEGLARLMPTAPKRPCPVPACSYLLGPDGRCPTHGIAKRWIADRGRGTTAERGYGSRHRRWAAQLLRDRPMCAGWPTGVHGVNPPRATEADHIIRLQLWLRDPVDAAQRLRAFLTRTLRPWQHLDAWSSDNGQGLCASCHGRKCREEQRGGGSNL